jgi:hypothetical protein
MNCYDCALAGRNTPAVGTCVNCGAGVCAQDVQLAVHELPHPAGPGNYTHLATRSLTCQTCAAVTRIPTPARKAHTAAAR